MKVRSGISCNAHTLTHAPTSVGPSRYFLHAAGLKNINTVAILLWLICIKSRMFWLLDVVLALWLLTNDRRKLPRLSRPSVGGQSAGVFKRPRCNKMIIISMIKKNRTGEDR